MKNQKKEVNKAMNRINNINSRPEDPMHADFYDLFYSYGLDFGTYRSMMAYKVADQPVPCTASYDTPSTCNGIPSLFWYSPKNNREYVCEEVTDNNGLFDDPQGVCTSIKTKLSDPDVFLNGKRFSTAYIAEKEIRRILSLSHQAMEKTLFDNIIYRKLVVGVPVRFGAARRQALVSIMERATDGKKIILLPEPIAAALMYSQYARKKLEKVLVFDLGAGTFDTVLLVPNPQKTLENPYEYRALCPDGLTIAGDYFDAMMAELIIETLRAGHCTLNTDRLAEARTADHQKLMTTARNLKERLSFAESFSDFIEGTDHAGRPAIQKVTVYRKDFETKIRPALEKAVACAYNVLVRAGALSDSGIDILLVGGSTYIPLVRTMIEEKFPNISKSRILQKFPEQAVALGCALYARDEISDAPVAYAYAVRMLAGPENRPMLGVKIPSGAQLPYRITATYHTKWENQTTARFSFYEVENGQKGACLDISQGNPTSLVIKHSFGRPVPAATALLLTLELDRNGTLTVTIDDHGITPVETHRVSLSDIHEGRDET